MVTVGRPPALGVLRYSPQHVRSTAIYRAVSTPTMLLKACYHPPDIASIRLHDARFVRYQTGVTLPVTL